MESDKIEFINNRIENFTENKNEKDFTVLLNGQEDLEGKLQQFKKECDKHDKHKSKRRKKRYYNLGLMAKVEKTTNAEEVKCLLKNNTRTFLIDILTHKPNEIGPLAEMIRQAQKEQQMEEPHSKLVIGLALQITGDACRIGRLRNNCSLILAKSDIMTLTTNKAYRYGSFKEIAYAINLHYYLPHIKLYDEVTIGHHGPRGFVIKKLRAAIAIFMEEDGLVSSYDVIELPSKCYGLQSDALDCIVARDLEMAGKLQVDFIALPCIRSLRFLKFLQHKMETSCKFKLIGSIDLEYVSCNILNLKEIIKHLDYLWLTNLFSSDQILNTVLLQDIIPAAKSLKKPIIGSIPLGCCSDFKLFEGHEILWKIDCMFIEKSAWCNKYPLIVKKLLPIKDYRLAIAENTTALHDILSNIQSIANFIIRIISSIECQAIFIHTKCEVAAQALSRCEIYCPVYVMLPLEEPTKFNKQDIFCLIELAKNLNLRRNLRPILYTREINEFGYKPIDYGIEYARQGGCLETGDFIITLEVGKENGDEHAQLGVEEDMVLMRAIYVPASSAKFQYA